MRKGLYLAKEFFQSSLMNLRGNTINETCARKNVSINVQFRPVNIVCVFFWKKIRT